MKIHLDRPVAIALFAGAGHVVKDDRHRPVACLARRAGKGAGRDIGYIRDRYRNAVIILGQRDQGDIGPGRAQPGGNAPATLMVSQVTTQPGGMSSML